MRRIRYPEIDIAGSTNAVSVGVSIRPSSLRREAMHHLDDEGPVERTGQGPGVREAKPGERLGSVSGVPHHEHIVADYRYPVEPDIEVDALALIVVLDECEQTGPRVEIVLQPIPGQHGRERPDRQVSGRPGEVGAHDDVAAATPRRGELKVSAVTAIELAPIHEGPDAQRTARAHEVLQLVAGPPVAAGPNHDPAVDVEGDGGRVHEALEVDFEMIAILPVASEHSPFEPRRLPVRAPER